MSQYAQNSSPGKFNGSSTQATYERAGDAINESLSDSELISEVVSRIKEAGYDIALTLEATIRISKQGGTTENATSVTVLH